MVMRKDNALQMSHLMRNASYIPLYAQWDIAAHANDNCEHISSMVGRTWAEGGYAYTYDALNRLESAVFTPAEGLADRPGIERDRIPDFSVYYCYDLRGRPPAIPIYAVDADVSQQKGKPSSIHRVLPNGRANSFVGTTRGTQITTSFNITDDIISNYKRLNPYVR